MTIPDRIALLRRELSRRGLDGCLVVTDDFHAPASPVFPSCPISWRSGFLRMACWPSTAAPSAPGCTAR